MLKRAQTSKSEGEWAMAIVISMGERRNKQVITGSSNGIEEWFEKSLLDVEMHRVNMSRVDHPNHANEIVIDLLYIWAALYIGISSYWFVKYII